MRNFTPFDFLSKTISLHVLQIVITPLSYWLLKWSCNGGGNIVLPLIVMACSISFYISYKNYKRSSISVFTFFMSFGTAVILLVGNEEQSIFSHLLFYIIFFGSTGLSVLYLFLYLQKREGKNKLRFDTQKPKTLREKLINTHSHYKEIKRIWKDRKQNGLIDPLYTHFSTKKEREDESLIFVLGEEVEYNSSTFRKEKS